MIIFFGLMTLLGAAGWVREGNAGPMLVFLGFTLSSTWLSYRLRILGAPTIDMDSEGLRYACGGKEQAARWRDISEIQWDFMRNEIRFMRKDGEKPIRTHRSLVTADGEWFDMLIEEYWRPPRGRKR